MSADTNGTDLFCGAGGSTSGAKDAGLPILMASNHWQLAVDSHEANHPTTKHDCADISQIHPRRYPRTTFLLASPECTNHSLAKGVRRKAQEQYDLYGCEDCRRFGEENCKKHSDSVVRSRATMWDVPRFAEYHRYEFIIVENVDDARKWECWDGWWLAMERLGYMGKIVSLNSMFAHPTPQSRDRMYVVWWKKGNRAPDLEYRPPAFCPRCCCDVEAVQTWKPRRTAGKYKQQYIFCCPNCLIRPRDMHGAIKDRAKAAEVKPYYYAALNALDLTLRAERIGDRKRKLKERTVGRIKHGIRKFGRQSLLITTNMTSDGGRSRPVTDPHFTQTGSALQALLSPIVIETMFSHAPDSRAYAGTDTLPTQSARATLGIGLPPAVLHMQGGMRTHGVDEVLSTQVASCGQDWLLSKTPAAGVPFIVNAGSNGVEPRDTVDSIPTLTCSDRLGVSIPPAFMTTLRGTGDDQIPYTTAPVSDSLGTVTGGGVHHAIVQSAALLNLRDYRTVEQLVASLGHYLPTQVAAPQTAIVQRAPFLLSFYGNGDQVSGAADPIYTISTLDRHGVVEGDGDESIDDWYFRMLQPHEIGAGMAFPSNYIVLGNKREQVRQYGNAVTPPAMRILVRRCLEALEGVH